MCTMCQTLDPSIQTYDNHGVTSLTDGSVTASFSGTATGGEGAGLPTYSADQVATYLTQGYWSDTGRAQRSFDVSAGDTITVNFNGLGASAEATAKKALAAWTAVSGLKFVESNSAKITFVENNSGAYASSTTMGNTILSSTVNVDDSWASYGGYYLQTYIHEIGHALGLGHAGNYNGSANFSRDAHFANDSWQMTVMSYFDPNQNPNVTATRLFLGTAMMGDIAAIQALYGTPTNTETGNTVYGDNQTTGRFGMDLPSTQSVAIYDNGGVDLINLASRTANQVLDLREETFSNIDGKIGNVSIGRDTVIENATTGSGNDQITGNDAANVLNSGAGNDVLIGNGGDDRLIGGAGADQLTGGAGADTFVYLAMTDAGDTITDLTLTQGDRIDVSALLTAIGYSGSDPAADGILYLEAGTGGCYLVVDPDGAGGAAGTRLVFLTGRSSTTPVDTLITGGGGGGGSPSGGGGGGGNDTIHRITDAFVADWSEAISIVRDTDGGTDTLDLSEVTYRTVVNLNGGVTGKVYRNVIKVEDGSEIENLTLGSGNDRGYGNASANHLDGGAGNDRLYGGGAADSLAGGDGNDSLYGDEGDDALDGGAGNDKLYGGAGDDILTDTLGANMMYGGAGDDILTGGDGKDYLSGDVGDDTLIGAGGDDKLYGRNGEDILTGGDGNDYLNGGFDADFLYGDAGNDRLMGDRGADRLWGGEGNDYLRGGNDNDTVYGENGDDRVCGDRGDDTLSGGEGNDRLEGGADNDILVGGAGVDLLIGGSGADQFVFNSLSECGDTIYDFRADHGDQIVITPILEAASLSISVALDFGLLALVEEGRGAWLTFDADGSGSGAAVQIAYLNRIDVEDDVMTQSWFA